MMMTTFPSVSIVTFFFFFLFAVLRPMAVAAVDGPRYFHLPTLELQQQEVYLTQTAYEETVVAHASKGSDLHAGDFLTHADGVRILNGGLKAFLKNGDGEAVVPIVDEEDARHGGHRLLGYVLIQIVQPRKLSTRRGEIAFDLEEGGPAPSLKLGNLVVTGGTVKSTTDPSYQPPPYGGGPCLTGRDCFNFNGTCSAGRCVCVGPYTGTYCQLLQPETAAVAMMMKKTQARLETKVNTLPGQHQASGKAATGVDAFQLNRDSGGGAGGGGGAAATSTTSTNSKPPPPPPSSSSSTATASEVEREEENSSQGSDHSEEVAGGGGGGDSKKKKKRKKKKPAAAPPTAATSAEAVLHDWSADDPETSQPQHHQERQQQQQRERQRATPQESSPGSGRGSDRGSGGSGSGGEGLFGGGGGGAEAATVEDLYGAGKAYPEPLTAGRPPASVQQDRHRRRLNREVFIYSVRYRSGPLGLIFSNQISNATVVEKVVKGQQSEVSDVKEGDVLLAIDQFNVSTASAKVSQRVLATLPWPRILVFQTRYSGEDPKALEKKVQSRSFNASILYPPTLVGDVSFRLAEWAAALNLRQPVSDRLRRRGSEEERDDFCPIYRLQSPREDFFGCQVQANEFSFSSAVEDIVDQSGFVDGETEIASPFLALLMQESKTKGFLIEPRSAAIMKRGLCTFVEKVRLLDSGRGSLGLVVNTEDEVIDMPAGRENPGESPPPLGILRSSEGDYLHLAARTNEVWIVIHENTGGEGGLSASCQRAVHAVEDIIDKWPHSVPPLSVQQVRSNKAPDQDAIRGLTEEGGRVALSGENGWAFFDYHLAMFGPQEVPLGPHRLVMALPPFGCDANAYTVRISGAIVAILRGGGCSFGIKVINAQKLGAKAVMIVNTDDVKTMRLMALPDEMPLIHIPCIMVSRRIQFYLEQQLRGYYPVDQHLVSIQPTGLFGEYEQRNALKLPVRLQV